MLATPRETPNEFLQDFILGCLFLTIAIVAALKYRRVANLQEAEVSDQHGNEVFALQAPATHDEGCVPVVE